MKNRRKKCALAIAVLLGASALAACSEEAELPSDNGSSSIESSAEQASTESAAIEANSENSSYDPAAIGAYADGSHPEFRGDRLRLTINDGEEEPGYDPVTGEMVIYRPWANFTIFYGDFRYSDELVPLGKVESGLEIISGQTEDFTGTLTLVEGE